MHRDDLADQHLAWATRLAHRWQVGARLHESGGLQLHQGALPIPAPFMNTMIRLDPTLAAAEALAQARAHFGRTTPFAPMTTGHQDADLAALLREEGFHLQADLAVMVTESAPERPPIADHWHLHTVEGRHNPEGEPHPALGGFIDCCAEAYASLGLPPFMTPHFFGQASAVLSPEVSLVLARQGDGPPGAVAMVLHTGEMAGLYWVATRSEARGQGLAAACTVAATELALARGARAVALQASPMGDPIYRRLGWRETSRIQRWSN